MLFVPWPGPPQGASSRDQWQLALPAALLPPPPGLSPAQASAHVGRPEAYRWALPHPHATPVWVARTKPTNASLGPRLAGLTLSSKGKVWVTVAGHTAYSQPSRCGTQCQSRTGTAHPWSSRSRAVPGAGARRARRGHPGGSRRICGGDGEGSQPEGCIS